MPERIIKQILDVVLIDNIEWPVGFRPTQEDSDLMHRYPMETIQGFIGTITAGLITIIRGSKLINMNEGELLKEAFEIIKGKSVDFRGIKNLIRIDVDNTRETGIEIYKDDNDIAGKTNQEVTAFDVKQLSKGIESWIRVLHANKLSTKEKLLEEVTSMLEQGFIDTEMEVEGHFLKYQ